MAAALQPILSNDPSIGASAIPAGATINFTGHSLGGHVAILLAEMVAQYGNSTIGDIATYNAPGINAVPYEILNWLTIGTATTLTGVLANRVAIVSNGGVDITAGLGLTNGIVQRTFIETSANPISNHSMVKLSDSFAIKNVFATLDPAIAALDQARSVPLLDAFINQSSKEFADSLEKTLDALRKTILGVNITPTVVSGSELAAARDSYYLHIQELIASPSFQALIGKVTIEAAPTNGSEARTDLGAFLSLYYLTPFALHTTDAAAKDALYNAHSALAGLWNDDRNLTTEC
jgi:Lipase (class 3)